MMNFCVIGLKWGKNYVRNLDALGQNISFICSRNPTTLAEEFLKYAHVTNYKDIDISLIDTACICTPPSEHFEMAKYFLRKGKNIIVEKPFVFSVREAIELKELAMEAGASILVSYQYLWNNHFLASKNKCKNIAGNVTIENISAGNVTRPDYSYLWDYSSHDLAMSFSISGIPTDLKIKRSFQTINSFNYQLESDNYCITSEFTCSDTKMRKLQISSDNFLEIFEDDYSVNSLKAMLAAFVQSIAAGQECTNIDLAIAVTEALTSIEQAMDFDN
jgi:predicted dehydrogenase